MWPVCVYLALQRCFSQCLTSSAPRLIVARDFLQLFRNLCVCALTIRTTRSCIKHCFIIIILPPIEVLFQWLIINAVIWDTSYEWGESIPRSTHRLPRQYHKVVHSIFVVELFRTPGNAMLGTHPSTGPKYRLNYRAIEWTILRPLPLVKEGTLLTRWHPCPSLPSLPTLTHRPQFGDVSILILRW